MTAGFARQHQRRNAYLALQQRLGAISPREIAELQSAVRLIGTFDDPKTPDDATVEVFAFSLHQPSLANWLAAGQDITVEQAEQALSIRHDDERAVSDGDEQPAKPRAEQPAPDDECRTRPATDQEKLLFGAGYTPRRGTR